MHPTRRKLADMVFTGEYDRDATVGWTPDKKQRNVGDVWEDEHHRYEKKEGYILKSSKNSQALQEIRDYVSEQNKCKNNSCKTIKLSEKDKKLIKKSGYCINCLAEVEHVMRTNGLWSDYQNYKIWTTMVKHGKAKIDQLKQAYEEAKQEYEYVNEDGSVEKWVMPTPVEEVKKDLLTMIENGSREIEQIEEKRAEAYSKLKEKHYEHIV